MFRQGFSCPALLVVCSVPLPSFRIRGYHPLLPDFPFRSTNQLVITYRLFPFRSPLLWESRLIFFLQLLRCFSSLRSLYPPYIFRVGVTLARRVSPFGHLRIKARLPAPRSFSQATTSFIACNRQGIHHVHLVA